MKSLIDTLDLTKDELQELMDTALDIQRHPEKYSERCHGKKLATLFFEPSTRTRLSFEAAMYELGGHVLSVASAASASTSKGESIADTVKTVSCYADIIAMRHPWEGAAQVAAQSASIPVINAGDGGHCHPTQTLADLLTIYERRGGFQNMRVGLCGDLKYGRTVHSLIGALARYENVEFILISPSELRLPDYVKEDVIEKSGLRYKETASLEESLGELDILYMTRIQRERFDDPAEYERLKDSYVLTEEKMHRAKKDCMVMHPLPRVNEISVRVDQDPRACYFRQMLNGKYMRMALILKLLSEKEERAIRIGKPVSDAVCRNPKCVCAAEQELPPMEHPLSSDGIRRCFYCDNVLSPSCTNQRNLVYPLGKV